MVEEAASLTLTGKLGVVRIDMHERPSKGFSYVRKHPDWGGPGTELGSCRAATDPDAKIPPVDSN